MQAISGLVSGIDTASLVDQLIAIERRPITLLNNRKNTWQKQMDVWRDINTRLNSLKTKVTEIQDFKVFNAQKIASNNESVATAKSNGTSLAGTYTLEVINLATSTKATSGASISSPLNSTVNLEEAGFAVTPTGGKFTVNGTEITIDAKVDSLDDVISKINISGAGVTASYDNLTDKFTITSNSGVLNLGSGADTSNFLHATRVLAQTGEGVTSVTSDLELGGTKVSAKLSEARLATPFSVTAGTFSINGVDITYDTTQDSLKDIINRVNESQAKVTMAYDSINDKITIQAKDTGRLDILLEDKTGNFLEVVKIDNINATKTFGQNATFKLDETQMTNTSNSVTGVVEGLTFELKKGAPGELVTISVNQDADSTFNKIKDFVDQYNTLQNFMASKMAKGADLQGDYTLMSLQSNLRKDITGSIEGITTELKNLSSIGIQLERSGTLKIDDTKLKEAIKAKGFSVYNLFNSENPEGIAQKLEKQIDLLTKSGTGLIPEKQKGYEDRIKGVNKKIEQMEARIEMRRETMLRQFRAMEQAMSKFNSQGAWLEGQIKQLEGMAPTK